MIFLQEALNKTRLPFLRDRRQEMVTITFQEILTNDEHQLRFLFSSEGQSTYNLICWGETRKTN